MPEELIALMQRFNALGRLLPAEDLEDVMADPGKRAECSVILNEMAKVQVEIDAFLGSRH